MRTLSIMTSLGLVGLVSTVAWGKVERLPTQAEFVDTWIGNSDDNRYTYRCELGQDQKGVLFSKFMDDEPQALIIEHWAYENARMNITLDLASRQTYDMVEVIVTRAIFPKISLRLKGKDWEIPVSLVREKPFITRYESLRDAAKAWHTAKQ